MYRQCRCLTLTQLKYRLKSNILKKMQVWPNLARFQVIDFKSDILFFLQVRYLQCWRNSVFESKIQFILFFFSKIQETVVFLRFVDAPLTLSYNIFIKINTSSSKVTINVNFKAKYFGTFSAKTGSSFSKMVYTHEPMRILKFRQGRYIIKFSSSF